MPGIEDICPEVIVVIEPGVIEDIEDICPEVTSAIKDDGEVIDVLGVGAAEVVDACPIATGPTIITTGTLSTLELVIISASSSVSLGNIVDKLMHV